MLERLTAREREVLDLLAAGKSTKEIAHELGISFKTAACHRAHILSKFGSHNTAELLAAFFQSGHRAPSEVPRVVEEHRRELRNLREALDAARALRFQMKDAREQLQATREETEARCAALVSSSGALPRAQSAGEGRETGPQTGAAPAPIA